MPSSYTLGPHFESFIRKQVKQGRYTSASEVLRDALRLLENQEASRQASLQSLREQIDVGRNSGPAKAATGVLDRLERKYAKMTKRGK